VEALYGRIHAAARRVCEQPAGELAATRACMTKAESQAIGKVNVPLLTAFYQKKTRSHPQRSPRIDEVASGVRAMARFGPPLLRRPGDSRDVSRSYDLL
jgi:hypothetical protein